MVRSPEAIADHFTGDLVPVIVEDPPARNVGMIWRDDFDRDLDLMMPTIEAILRARSVTYRTITKKVSTAGRPYVLVST